MLVVTVFIGAVIRPTDFYLFLRLEKMGALEVDKVVHRHQAWRLISCIWLHAGVIHVLANMLSLVFIGIRLEQEFGFGIILVCLHLFHLLNINMTFVNRSVFICHHLHK